MRSTPRFPFDIPDCVDLHGAESPRCRSPRSSALGASDAGLRGDVERTGAAFLDLTRYFCDAIECFPVAGNIVIYRDHDHLTPAYVSTMKIPLAESLRALIRAHAQPPPASRSARAATTRQS